MNKLCYGLAVLVTIVAVMTGQGRVGLAASAVVLVAGVTGAILGRRNSLLASSCFFLALVGLIKVLCETVLKDLPYWPVWSRFTMPFLLLLPFGLLVLVLCLAGEVAMRWWSGVPLRASTICVAAAMLVLIHPLGADTTTAYDRPLPVWILALTCLLMSTWQPRLRMWRNAYAFAQPILLVSATWIAALAGAHIGDQVSFNDFLWYYLPVFAYPAVAAIGIGLALSRDRATASSMAAV